MNCGMGRGIGMGRRSGKGRGNERGMRNGRGKGCGLDMADGLGSQPSGLIDTGKEEQDGHERWGKGKEVG